MRELEKAYTESRYGIIEYEMEDVEELLKATKDIMDTIESSEKY